MRTVVRTSLVILFMLFFVEGNSQTLQPGQYWIRYFLQASAGGKYNFQLEVDERRFFDPNQQAQFFMHIHAHRKLGKKWDVGMGFNYNASNVPDHNAVVLNEFRPWQEVNWSAATFAGWKFQLRYRLDERSIQVRNGNSATNEYRFNLRHRFRFQFTHTLTRPDASHPITMKLYDEIMVNTGSSVRAYDQNRLGLLFEYELSKNWSIEPGYVWQHQPRNDIESFDRQIVRITVYHRISLKAKDDSGDL